MRERRFPSSLAFLAVLVLLSIGAAIAGGLTLYVQTRVKNETQAETMTAGHVAHGHALIVGYGCGSCHVIPGVDGANGKVGPDLTGIAKRAAIAGSLSNDPDTMVRWLKHPQALRPGSGMPEMGISDPTARDIAAYLYARS